MKINKTVYLTAILLASAVCLCSCKAGADNTNVAEEPAQTEEAATDPGEEETGSSQTSGTMPEEATDEFLASVAKDSAPDIDISGCDTFTQIVDKKLADGMGYANEQISGEDVLIVCSQTYDNLDGNMAGIDATVFMYKDEAPFEVGKVCCGGTAYPLAIKDGVLYTGSNHWVCKYAIEDDKLVITEKGAMDFDEDGNEVYYYERSDGSKASYATKEAGDKFSSLFDEMFSGTIVNFSTVGGRRP